MNTCVVCDRVGFAPQVLEPDFVVDPVRKVADLTRHAMRCALVRNYKALPLDKLGRCPICASVGTKEEV
jgi:hypothetical protein